MRNFLVILLFILLLPVTSYAAWEYITHGGYDAAVSAWTRTALIFSDNNYKGLFISAIVLGAIAIFVATYVRAVTGAKVGGLSWATPVLIGMAVYVAFIAPKDKLIIYDELLNRGPQEIGGIPLILATSAGVLNKIEKGFIDIISTSTDPASDYRMNAGGIGWSLLETNPVNALPSTQYATVQRFIQDCVYMELIRDGTILDINKIARGEQKWNTIIEESKNRALYTVVYTSNGAGDTKTCFEAGDIVKDYITSFINNPSQEAVKMICASKGFNTTGASLNVCKNLIASILATTFFSSSQGSLDLGVFIAQKIMADAFMEVATSKSPSVAISTLATSQTQSQLIGLGMHANSWIPVLKESLTAVAVSISPLLLLFAATPLVGRAVSLVFGMFVWLTMWGIIDAVIHAFGVDLAKQASQQLAVTSPDMGFTAIFMWPSYTAKVAATFGALRWSGLMLASVISGMLVKFGGTALAMLAGSISAMPQSSGAAYGGTGLRNMGGVVSSEIMPTQTWANASIVAGGINNLTRGLVQRQAGEMAGGASFGNELGMAKIAQATRGSLLGSAVSGLGTGMAIDFVGTGNAVKAEAVQRTEQYQKGATLYDEYSGLAGASKRGQISGQMYGGSFAGIEEQRSVYSKASGRDASYGNLSEAISSGKKVVAYNGDRGYVQLGSGAIVFVDGDNNYALLGMDSPVRSSINEGITYREVGRALWSNKVTQRFANSLINKWFDSTSGEYRKEVGEQFKNTFSQTFLEKVASSESLSKTLGFKKDEIAQWQVTAGSEAGIGLSGVNAKVYIDFNTGYMTKYDKTTGIETRQQLTQEQLNEIKTAYDYAKHKGWNYVVSSRSGFEYVRSKAKEDSYEVGKAFEQSYEEAKSYGKTVDLNIQNSIFHSYTLAKYGAVTVDTVAKADADFRRMSATGDYSELWKTIDKPVTGTNPETVKDKISEIQNMVYNEGGRLAEQRLNAPVGDPNVVNPGVNLDIKEPNYSFVKGKKISVNDLVNKFNKEHENTGALGLMVKDSLNTLTGPMDVLFGVDPMQNRNPLNPKNIKYTW